MHRISHRLSIANRIMPCFSVFVLALTGACSSSTNNASSGGNENPSAPGETQSVSTADCARRCIAKIKTCGLDSDQAKFVCDGQCNNHSFTESEMVCVETKTCAEIERANSVAELCGSKPTPAPTTTSTTPTPPASLPTTLEVSGSLPSGTKATHSQSGNDIASLVVLNSAPSFSPSKPRELPNIAAKGLSFTVDAPERGTCQPSINFTLNASEIGVVITGVDTLPSADCALFTDAVSKNGFKATLSDVPYPNSATKATVKIDIH